MQRTYEARRPVGRPARRPARQKFNSFEKDHIAYRARVRRRAGMLCLVGVFYTLRLSYNKKLRGIVWGMIRKVQFRLYVNKRDGQSLKLING